MRELFKILKQACEQGKDTVLVTVVDYSGSTPRGTGAHMLVDEKDRIYGTVGGGAGENRAIEIAKKALEKRCCKTETFLLYPNDEKDLGMICGGEMTMYFQYLPGNNKRIYEIAEQVERCYVTGAACWLVLNITQGDNSDSSSKCVPEFIPSISLFGEDHLIGAPVPDTVLEKRPTRPKYMEVEEGIYYMERLQQPGRVYIFGGGHVAQALVPVLASVDFRCVIVEDRPEFCRKELFTGVEEVRLIPMEELESQLSIEPVDYICVVTRGHKNDTECEAFALRTPARYIGVIGSRRKIAAVNEKLKGWGFTEEDLKRVATPIGLPIQAETPAEIAISIAAQLIQVRAQS